jgi:hypothetical protein
MQRTAIALILTLLVFCQVGSVWTLFSTAIWLHKQNKAVRLADQSRWEEFSLSKTQFESWLQGDDEIEINNKLYDIVSIDQTKDQVIIIAVADHAENKMKRTLSCLQKDQSGWSQLAKRAQEFSFSNFRPEKTLRFSFVKGLPQKEYYQFAENLLCKGLQKLPDQPPSF